MKKIVKEIHSYPSLYAVILITVLLTAVAFMGTYIAPNDPYELDYNNPLIAGSAQYPLGTDALGRCMLSRLLDGGSLSISMTFLAVISKLAAGAVLGAFAGLKGGLADTIVMRCTDLFMALPDMVCVIALVGIAGPGLFNTMLAMTVIGWTRYSRLVYTQIQELKYREFIQMARFAGVTEPMIVWRYMLPNLLPHVIVFATQDIASTLLTFSALSLLGLGPQLPAAEWGNMLSIGKGYLQTAPRMMIYPGLCILIFVICYNLIGDLLRNRLDPQHKNIQTILNM